MSLIYRAIFSDERQDLILACRRLFAGWLATKNPSVQLPASSGRFECDGVAVSVVEERDGDVGALRLRLDEEVGSDRWSTILTAMTAPGEQYVWVDLERVSEEAYGFAPALAPPRLLREFVAGGTCRVGPTLLRSEPLVIDSDRVGALLAELKDPCRLVPIVVVSRDLKDEHVAAKSGQDIARLLMGIATVWVLTGTATGELSKALGPDLHVYGGAVRTYLPGLTVSDPNPYRHRFLRRERFEPSGKAGAEVVARGVVARAVAVRPPVLYRERIARLPGFVRGGGIDSDELLRALIEAEDERDQLKDELLDAVYEAADEARRAAALEQRVRWLTEELAKRGQFLSGTATPAPSLPEIADDCVEALELAEEHLDRLVIGDTIESAEEIDRHVKAPTWGRKAWAALRALQLYAEAKASGQCLTNFSGFCRDPRSGSPIPAEWVAPGESETTTNNAKYYQARVFPVPKEVDAAGAVYMEEHIRLEKGSDPAPRLHFWDDTAKTGRIYVGYLGRHLPSAQTN